MEKASETPMEVAVRARDLKERLFQRFLSITEAEVAGLEMNEAIELYNAASEIERQLIDDSRD